MTDTTEATGPNLPTCQCRSVVAYTVTADDLPELTAEERDAFVPYPVYQSCGTYVSKGKTFAPGHDAKYKSALIAEFRRGLGEFHYLDGGLLIISDVEALADEREWAKFLTQAKPRKSRAKGGQAGRGSLKGKGAKAQGQAQPDSDQPAAGFRPCQVKVGRWWKDGNVSAILPDGRITVAYKDGKGDPKVITVEADKVKEG